MSTGQNKTYSNQLIYLGINFYFFVSVSSFCYYISILLFTFTVYNHSSTCIYCTVGQVIVGSMQYICTDRIVMNKSLQRFNTVNCQALITLFTTVINSVLYELCIVVVNVVVHVRSKCGIVYIWQKLLVEILNWYLQVYSSYLKVYCQILHTITVEPLLMESPNVDMILNKLSTKDNLQCTNN